jgi:hypothetical protein
MKLISKILLRVVQSIEGCNIEKLDLVRSMGHCNTYKRVHKPNLTTGDVISSMPYKSHKLALRQRSHDTKSEYVGTKQIFVRLCQDDIK